MAAFFRLLTIYRVIFRYRLDQLVPRRQLPWGVRLLLLPCRVKPAPRTSRGERLRLAFEDLGPVFVKFGQLLSTRPDLMPADIVGQLDALQDKVPPFPADKFRALVEEALGESVDSAFRHYETEPLASASVAQVHGAVLKTGEPVVIKVVRPGIDRVIEQDLRLMEFLARRLERTADGRRLRPVEVVQDYRLTIFDELDMQREAANASQLRRNFHNSPLLYVPDVHWDYIRPNVLVMERIEGIPVTDLEALQARGVDMKALAERGVEIFFTQVFEHNFFHADMHPGNIFVNPDRPHTPQYMAVDMAIVGSLTRADQYYLARNLLAMFRRDYRQVAELHVQSGWIPADTRVEELEAAVRTVCEPIFERPLKDISFGLVMLNLFRTARRFDMQVQPQLVLLEKTLLNVEGLGRQLYPDLDLWQTAHPFLERWLKQRFSPTQLWSELTRYGPEWMERFPQVPELMFNGLQNLQRLGEPDETAELRRQQRRAARQRQRRRQLLGSLALAGAAWLAWPTLSVQPVDWSLVPAGAWLLGGAGLSALLLR